MNTSTVLLAFSGGLDTSAMIPWLSKTKKLQVVAYCADLGNLPDSQELSKKAFDLGAHDFVFEDLKEHFVAKYLYPMIRSGASYQGQYLLGTAIARPLMAKSALNYARQAGISQIAHGATGKGNDHIRFERVWRDLAPEFKIIAPWKIWDFKGRSDLLNYLKQQG